LQQPSHDPRPDRKFKRDRDAEITDSAGQIQRMAEIFTIDEVAALLTYSDAS